MVRICEKLRISYLTWGQATSVLYLILKVVLRQFPIRQVVWDSTAELPSAFTGCGVQLPGLGFSLHHGKHCRCVWGDVTSMSLSPANQISLFPLHRCLTNSISSDYRVTWYSCPLDYKWRNDSMKWIEQDLKINKCTVILSFSSCFLHWVPLLSAEQYAWHSPSSAMDLSNGS